MPSHSRKSESSAVARGVSEGRQLADALRRRTRGRKAREDLRRMVGKGPLTLRKDFADQHSSHKRATEQRCIWAL